MNSLQEQTIYCPYCGEQISVLVDSSDCDQRYIEDCQVCCRPINFHITQDLQGYLQVSVFDENEAL